MLLSQQESVGLFGSNGCKTRRCEERGFCMPASRVPHSLTDHRHTTRYRNHVNNPSLLFIPFLLTSWARIKISFIRAVTFRNFASSSSWTPQPRHVPYLPCSLVFLRKSLCQVCWVPHVTFLLLHMNNPGSSSVVIINLFFTFSLFCGVNCPS